MLMGCCVPSQAMGQCRSLNWTGRRALMLTGHPVIRRESRWPGPIEEKVYASSAQITMCGRDREAYGVVQAGPGTESPIQVVAEANPEAHSKAWAPRPLASLGEFQRRCDARSGLLAHGSRSAGSTIGEAIPNEMKDASQEGETTF